MKSRLTVKVGSRILFLYLREIRWIEAERDHVRFHQSSGSFLVRDTMQSLEKRLDPRLFMRVHRSLLVNIDHIKEMRPLPSGGYEILMKDIPERLLMSKVYRDNLRELLDHPSVP